MVWRGKEPFLPGLAWTPFRLLKLETPPTRTPQPSRGVPTLSPRTTPEGNTVSLGSMGSCRTGSRGPSRPLSSGVFPRCIASLRQPGSVKIDPPIRPGSAARADASAGAASVCLSQHEARDQGPTRFRPRRRRRARRRFRGLRYRMNSLPARSGSRTPLAVAAGPDASASGHP